MLEELGIGAVVVDVFDAGALKKALWAASPDVVIHQLTDLSGDHDAASIEGKLRGNARLRREGTANLVAAAGQRAITISEGVVPLESAILEQAAFDGVILRYGQLFGPGTWTAEPTGAAPLHVEAAAYAAFLAVSRGRPGVYNIANRGGALTIDKALSELGWLPDFRLDGQV
jgi:hypothetical protein